MAELGISGTLARGYTVALSYYHHWLTIVIRDKKMTLKIVKNCRKARFHYFSTPGFEFGGSKFQLSQFFFILGISEMVSFHNSWGGRQTNSYSDRKIF